jgi:NAD(P)-dependent dehydrogenase (short-subunit alcohol dehydrogenase family)
MEIIDSVAIVTGAAAGTGRSIALRLAGDGAALVVADIDARGGDETVRRIEAGGGRAVFVESDVRHADAVLAMVSAAEDTYGGLDILVNNAGGTPEPHYPSADPSHWQSTLDLNLRGPMLATQVALEAMRPRGRGVVVNISSTAGLGYRAYSSPEYGAAKAGLIRFTASLAFLGTEQLRVNCVVPDWIGTERAEEEIAQMSEEERASLSPPIALDVVLDAVVRFIHDDDLAGRVMVLWRDEEPRLVDPSRRE